MGGLCPQFPSLSWPEPDKAKALAGVQHLVQSVVADEDPSAVALGRKGGLEAVGHARQPHCRATVRDRQTRRNCALAIGGMTACGYRVLQVARRIAGLRFAVIEFPDDDEAREIARFYHREEAEAYVGWAAASTVNERRMR